MEKKKREFGFYWVKYGDEWIVGKYDYDTNWYITESDRSKGDSDFEKIDENQIRYYEKTEQDDKLELLILVTYRDRITEEIQKEIDSKNEMCDECDYFYKKGLQEAINIINNLK